MHGRRSRAEAQGREKRLTKTFPRPAAHRLGSLVFPAGNLGGHRLQSVERTEAVWQWRPRRRHFHMLPPDLSDTLMDTLTAYEGSDIRYCDGVVESSHVPRAGANSFEISGDAFANRFVMSTPIDGYGLPNIYLSLLRQICSNGMVGYAKTFRTTLALGRGGDDVI